MSFAVFPLVIFTSDKAKMGGFAHAPSFKVLTFIVAGFTATLNGWLLVQTIVGWAS